MSDNGDILVVDDAVVSLTFCSNILTAKGYDVRQANGGEPALMAVENQIPDLMLLDIRMPGIDGFEVCRRLMSGEKTRHIPIILISACTDAKERVNGLKWGAVDYLAKPFEPEELLARIRIHLSLSRARASLECQAVTLNQTNEALRSEMAERKRAEESQRQLLKELESVNRELREFAYVVSHDLKAPLRGIDSLVSWIATDYADRFDEAGKENLALLVARVCRMHALIDGILEYSRMGSVREQLQPIDLSALIPEIIDLLAPPTHVAVTVETSLPVLLAERARIQQVFQNLIGNAIKYMDKPSGNIRIGCRPVDGFWEFYVADDGPGIEERYFEKIFQIFQTAHNKPGVESTGVGLTIVKKIVEMYGGSIEVESVVGKGSCFRFRWPQAREQAPSVDECDTESAPAAWEGDAHA
jgi:signal transduction histidine kinase